MVASLLTPWRQREHGFRGFSETGNNPLGGHPAKEYAITLLAMGFTWPKALLFLPCAILRKGL